MHKILERQLKRGGLSADALPTDETAWRDLLDQISEAYEQMEQDRYLLERSLEVSTREMQEINDRLKSEHERLDTLITLMGDGLCMLDAEGRAQFANPVAERLLGRAQAELKEVSLLAWVSPGGLQVTLGDLLADGRTLAQEADFQCYDGSALPVAFVLTPITEAGELTGAVLTFRDITARKQAEAAVRQARDDLEQQNRQLERVNEFFRVTVEHMIGTVQRGSNASEMLAYLGRVQAEFDRQV